MKEFKKTKKEIFICKECKKIFDNKISLGTHIGMVHNSKLYYDKWLKKDKEGFCKICGKETKFSGKLTRGYYDTCSKNCQNIYRVSNIKKTLLKKFNVENVFQLKEVKEKKKQTYFKHFGVDHNMKNRDNFEKQQKSGFKLSQYKNTNIYYRGSYELDFLEKFYDKFPQLCNGPSIKYKFKEKESYYHSDFYIPSLNLIVEIKNSYLVKKDKYILNIKRDAVISEGFKYIMIVNKNYKNFKKNILNIQMKGQKQDHTFQK